MIKHQIRIADKYKEFSITVNINTAFAKKAIRILKICGFTKKHLKTTQNLPPTSD